MGLADLAARTLIPAAAAGMLAACAHLPLLVEPRDPLTAEEHARLGASYAAQGLRAQALGQFDAATRLAPGDAEAWVAMGNVSFEEGDLAAAERAYRRALKASPGHPGASNNLAMVYLAGGKDLVEAERLAREALGRDGPLKPFILDTLADICLRQGRYPEARAALAQALAVPGADDPGVRDQLRRTLARIDDAEREEAISSSLP